MTPAYDYALALKWFNEQYNNADAFEPWEPINVVRHALSIMQKTQSGECKVVPVEPTDDELEKMYFESLSGDPEGPCSGFLKYARQVHQAAINAAPDVTEE